jgi:hypothetical protein
MMQDSSKGRMIYKPNVKEFVNFCQELERIRFMDAIPDPIPTDPH